MVRTIDAQSDTTAYGYDALYLSSVEDPEGQTYDYTRNALGWMTDRTDPRGVTASFGYDAVGRRTSWTTRTGATVTYAYDALGHLTSRTADGATATFATDPDGWWRAAENGASTDTVFFDRAGRVDREVTVRGGTRYVLATEYGARGQLTELQIEEPSARADTVRYIYDSSLRLDTLVDFSGGATSRSFDPDWRVTEQVYPGADTLTITYDSISHARKGYTFSRNTLNEAMQNSVLRDSTLRPVTQARASDDTLKQRVFDYDPTSQLTGWEEQEWEEPTCDFTGCTGGGWTTISSESFSYDGAGNRTDSGATIATGNRLTDFDGYDMTWDAAGRLTDKTGNGLDQNFYWSATGRLDSVETDGQMTRYRYDAFGRRVEKDGPSGTTGYVWNASALTLTTDGAGSVVAEFTHGPGVDRPHAMRRGGTTYYYGRDHLGGIWGLFEGGGPMANTYRYDPWGNVQLDDETVENPLQFTGREWDAEPGLLYLRNRYYDPAIARFVSQDPIGLSGGLNPYVYAANSPVALTDPFGLDPCDVESAAKEQEDACEVEGVGVTVSGGSNRTLLAAFQPTHLTTTAGPHGPAKAAGFGRGGGAQDNSRPDPDSGDPRPDICDDLDRASAIAFVGSTVSAFFWGTLVYKKFIVKGAYEEGYRSLAQGTGAAFLKIWLASGEVFERVPRNPVDLIPFVRMARLEAEQSKAGCNSSSAPRFPLESGLM